MKPSFLHNRRGSFTLELSIWFPVLLLTIIIGLIAGLIVYQRAALYSLAVQTAERAAYIWDNSYKDAASGYVEAGRRDGLYWRLTSDGSLPFLSGGAGNPIHVAIPELSGDDSMALPEKKLFRSTNMLPIGIEGEIQYENKIAEKVVSVSFVMPIRLPPFLASLFGYEHRVKASAVVHDPVEYMRGIDLIRTYTGIAKEHFSPEEARALFQEPMPDGNNADVQSEAEAARWVRLQTGGKRTTMATSSGNRLIDSLTSDNTAHQAYYTYTEHQILEQAVKDAELIQEGKVNGVVWHFFLGVNNRNPAPSAQLLHQLQQYGIRVEVHAGGG